MENENNKINKQEEQPKKPLKPCCACPETRKLRDECIRNKSEEDCLELIENHKECLKKLGFQV
jgi:cytochrome c oxidase assembly protein subunit 17